MSLRGFGVGLGWLVGAVVALSVSAAGQTLRVRVVDASGLPVAGATVSSGTTVVGTTGADGAAEVSVPTGGMLKAASAGMVFGPRGGGARSGVGGASGGGSPRR